jgi:hypothetical protein
MNGQSLDAKKIGYASKIIETRIVLHSHAWDAVTMLISRWINGYGYYQNLVILWAMYYFVIGGFVISSAKPDTINVDEGFIRCVNRSGWRKYLFGPYCFHVIKYTKGSLDTEVHEKDYGVINPFGYSFETLLPIIKLSELHYEVELDGWRHYYFYFHRIVGWWLGIFVLGALSGLAK